MASYVNTILAEASLVSYWKLNEVTGTVAIDSKSSNNGIYNNLILNQLLTPIYTKGVLTNQNTFLIVPSDFTYNIEPLSPSILFDGKSSFIHVSDNTNLHLTNLSLECWFNLISNLVPNGQNQVLYLPSQVIFFKGNLGGAGWGLGISDGGFLEVYTNGQWFVSSSNQLNLLGAFPQRILSLGWHHIVCTISSSTINIYLDSILIWSLNLSTSLSNTQPLYIGKTINNNNYLNGYLMHAAIYNNILTQTQVTTHYLSAVTSAYNNIILSESSLLSYWRFNEGLNAIGSFYSGTTLIDSKGSNNGTYELIGSIEPNQSGPQYTYVVIPDSGNLHSFSEITIELTLNLGVALTKTGVHTNTPLIFLSKYSGSPGVGFAIRALLGGEGWQLEFWTGTEWFNCSNNGSSVIEYFIEHNNEQQNTDFALTLDSSGNIKVYGDGMLMVSGNVTFDLNTPNDIVLGGDQLLSVIPGIFAASNFAIYNTALSHQDILLHRTYRQPRGFGLSIDRNQNYNYQLLILNESSLLSYWPLNDLTGEGGGSGYLNPAMTENNLIQYSQFFALDLNCNSNAAYNNGIYVGQLIGNLNGIPSGLNGALYWLPVNPALQMLLGAGSVAIPPTTTLQNFTNVTFEIWCSIGSLSQPDNSLANTFQNIPLNYALMLKSVGAGGFCLGIINNTFQFFDGNNWTDSEKFVNDIIRHHYVVTLDSSGNLLMYVDGFLVKSATITPNLNSPDIPLSIGPWPPITGVDILGFTHDCAIYNSVLSSTDIRQHYIYGKLTLLNFGNYDYPITPYALQILSEPLLVSYWQFSEDDNNIGNTKFGIIKDWKANNDANFFAYSVGSNGDQLGNTTLTPSFYFGPNVQNSSVVAYLATTCFVSNEPSKYVTSLNITPPYLTSIDDNTYLNSLTKLSMEAWFNTTSLVQQSIFSKYNITLPCNGFALCMNNGKIGLYTGGDAVSGSYTIDNVASAGVNFGTINQPNLFAITSVEAVTFDLNTPNYIYTSQTYNDGNWHHVVATINDNGVINIYVDSLLVLTQTVSQHLLNTSLLFLGCDSNTYLNLSLSPPIPQAAQEASQIPFGMNTFAGYLMHLSIYNGILTQTQVNKHFALGFGSTIKYNPNLFNQIPLTYIQSILNEPPLIGYWQLSELSGTTAFDFKGFNNGIYSSTFTLNQSGNNTLSPSVYFNGGLVTITDNLSIQTPYINGFPYPFSSEDQNGIITAYTAGGLSIECWIFIPTSTSSQHIFLSKSNLSSQGFALAINNHTLQFYTGTEWLDSLKPIDNGQWHQIVVTFSGGSVTNLTGGIGVVYFYIDGNLVGFREGSYNLITTSDNLVFCDSLICNLMHVSMYGGVLSDSDILLHYKAGTTFVPPTILSITTYSSIILNEPSLVSYWKFDEPNGTIAYDSQDSNNGFYDQFINLYQIGNGFISHSINLIGNTECFVTISDNTNINSLTDTTIEIWILIPLSNTNANIILSKLTNTTNHGYALAVFNHTFQFYAGNGTSWCDSGIVVDDNNWHYVVGTIDSSGNIKVYVDGELCNTLTSYSQNLSNSGTALIIGDNQFVSINTIIPSVTINPAFTGNMMQCAVYNTVLSASDILSHYQAGISPQSPPIENYLLAGFSEMPGGMIN